MSKEAPDKIKYRGATYLRTGADKETVEKGYKWLHEDFKALFDAHMDVYRALSALSKVAREMGFVDTAQRVEFLRDVKHEAQSDEFRKVQHRLEEQIGEALNAKVVINW